jgi:hypothetical protein
MSYQRGLGNNLEGAIALHSVGGEAAAIEGENPICFQLLSQYNQAGVGETNVVGQDGSTSNSNHGGVFYGIT